MTLHPAITRAAALYDETRDLEQFEQDFLAAVYAATMAHARACGDARRHWGDLTPAFTASKYLIDRRQDEALSYALEQCEAAIEAADETLDNELALVAEVFHEAAE